MQAVEVPQEKIAPFLRKADWPSEGGAPMRSLPGKTGRRGCPGRPSRRLCGCAALDEVAKVGTSVAEATG